MRPKRAKTQNWKAKNGIWEEQISNFWNHKTEFEKFANFSNYFLSNEFRIFRTFSVFPNHLLNTRKYWANNRKYCGNTHEYWPNTWKMWSPASVILASIVTILVRFEAILIYFKGCGRSLLWNLQVLWQYSQALHLQVTTFFKYWVNTREYYHNTYEYCHNTCEYWAGEYTLGPIASHLYLGSHIHIYYQKMGPRSSPLIIYHLQTMILKNIA